MDKRRFFLLILILGLVSAISPFSIDMYLPAFPAMVKGLHTSISQIQLSLTSYFIGISVGQMLYGPLIDRFGRKMPLYFGLVVYLLASIGCGLASSAHTLIIMRFIQALGSCAGLVASRALVRDLFPIDKIAEVFSLLMLVIAVSPMVAPTVGAYVSTYLGWHSVFFVLAGVSFVILISCFIYLPNGRDADLNLSLKPKPIIKGFYQVSTHPQFYIYALTGSLAGAAIYAYLAGSPDIFIDLFHVSQKQYGWIFGFIAFGIIGSSQLNFLLLKKYNSHQIIRVALICQSIIGVIMFGITYLGFINPISLTGLIFSFLCFQGIIFPNASALSLAPFASQAGSASALMGTLQMGIAAISSGLVSVLHNGTAIPTIGVMALCSLSALTLVTLASGSISKLYKPAKI